MNIPRIGALAAATLISAGLLAGCGSSSDATTAADTTAAASTATASTATTEKVGGTATCDKASIQKAVEATGSESEPNTLATGDSFECADGWAYAYVNSGTGEGQYTATQVFQAEGQFWIPKDRAEVCKAPGDQVPAAIYDDACETN